MPKYLVWSNQKGAWWRSNRAGYTGRIDEAGRYDHDEATAIVKDATLDGQLSFIGRDPVTGNEYRWVDEVMVLAPEEVTADA